MDSINLEYKPNGNIGSGRVESHIMSQGRNSSCTVCALSDIAGGHNRNRTS